MIAAIGRSRRELSGALFHVFSAQQEVIFLERAHIDQFAAQGIRFTQALAGSPVCAPLRCNLMTGKHAGHASVRANDGGTPLRAGEATIASILKERGYATGGFGKNRAPAAGDELGRWCRTSPICSSRRHVPYGIMILSVCCCTLFNFTSTATTAIATTIPTYANK